METTAGDRALVKGSGSLPAAPAHDLSPAPLRRPSAQPYLDSDTDSMEMWE